MNEGLFYPVDMDSFNNIVGFNECKWREAVLNLVVSGLNQRVGEQGKVRYNRMFLGKGSLKREEIIMNHFSGEIEKRTINKTMRRILPFILILYSIAYLDRVNLGYAALQMNAELALSAEVFGLLSGIFFIGYFFFEVPSNMIMHKVGARIWIARIMISWGLVVILTGFAQTTMHLYILRFLLGVAEAGFFPGIILYLTYWFRAREEDGQQRPCF